jgi:hypothetical protein
MRRVMRVAVALMALAALAQASGTQDRAAILKAREAVWRAWFAGGLSRAQNNR